VALNAAELKHKSFFRRRHWTLNLDYRPELPTAAATEAEHARWQTEECEALASGDIAKARDCRALVERHTRWLTRLAALPPGTSFSLPITLWRMGDAFWLAVEAEHYQLLQTALRGRLPGVPIVVMTIANGSRAAYLPTAETYGKGIYQESIAVLARGSLEKLIDVLGREMAAWLGRG
jgi:hypothetical protein